MVVIKISTIELREVRTQKYQLLNYVEVIIKVYTTATDCIPSSIFTVDGVGGTILGCHFGSVWILRGVNFVNLALQNRV